MSNKMPWFRMYADFLNDPKLISLAFEDQRHFIGLLALKCDGALDGEIDPVLLDRIVAQRLWIDHAVIREVKRRLIKARLIGEDWQPLGWDKRQYQSDSSAERTRRYRERKQQEKQQVAKCDANVTSPTRHSDALDTDTDTEITPCVPLESGNDEPTPAGKPQRAHPAGQQKTMRAWLAEKAEQGEDAIPVDDPVFAYAANAGIPEDFVRLAWQDFRAKYINASKRYTSWPQAFRNCVRACGYGLWRATADGYALTSKGVQAQREVMALEVTA